MTKERWRRSRHVKFNHPQSALERLSARGPASGMCRLRIEPLEDRCLLAFAPAVPYLTSSHPINVTTADFNFDGKLDLAIAANGSDQVSIHMGVGDGTFQPGTAINLADEPFGVEAADFNSDGKLDLAVPIYGSDVLSVLLGNGNGTFQSRVDYNAGSFPTSVDSGDMNGDGKLDLVVVNNLGTSARVMLGNGDGTFQTGVSYGIHQSFGVALGDFNGDGKLDVAASGYVAGVVSVLLGNGNGTLQSRVDYAVGPNPYNVVLADFDRDGDLDLATAAYGADFVSVLYGNGAGAFPQRIDVPTSPRPLSVSAADFNMDGKLDLGVAISQANPDTTYSVGVLHGNGNGTFQTQTSYQVGHNPFGLTSGDFDRNGSPDLAVTNEAAASFSVLLNADLVPPSTIGNFVWDDYDGDGIQDAGEPGLSGVAVSLFSQPNGGVAVATAVTDSAGQYSFTIPLPGTYYIQVMPPAGRLLTSPNQGSNDALDSDIDSLTLRSGPVSVAPGESNLSVDGGLFAFDLQAGSPQSVGSRPQAVARGDFNGDNKLDVATVSLDSASLSVLISTGLAFQTAVNYPLGGFLVSVVAVDVNNDSKLDLLAGSYDTSQIGHLYVLLGNGNGTFQPASGYLAGEIGPWVAPGDFNGDGKVDLAVSSFDGGDAGHVNILLGNGSGAFPTRTSYATGSASYSVVIGDFNADGRSDLAVANRGSSNVSVLLGNGNGTFQSSINYPTTHMPLSLATADLNSDGKADLVTANWDNSTLSTLVGNGNGTFQSPMLTPTQGRPRMIVAADFNLDGQVDVAAPHHDTNNLGVYLGVGNGTFKSGIYQAAGNTPTGINYGDFDNSGTPDTVIANDLGNDVRVFYQTAVFPLATIGNVVWGDFDSDGSQDAGELGMSGVVVELFNSTDGLIGNGNDVSLGTRTTDAGGQFSFTNVIPGSYYLRFRKPNGFIFSTRNVGGDDALDSDANYYGFTELFTLAAGQNDVTRDAGLRAAADRIVFASNRDGDYDLYQMDTAGGSVMQLTNVAGSDNNGSWSPSGNRLLLSSNRDGDYEIYVMNADGSGLTQLTSNTADDAGPVWSPDGTKIAFNSRRDGNFEIYVMDADGSNQVRLTNNAFSDISPDWSPDGSRLTFYSDRDGNAEIYVVSASGGTATRLTTNAAIDSVARWSPDGKKLAFTSGRDGDGDLEIFVMNADGTGVTQLTFNFVPDNGADWSPDGTKITFWRDSGPNREIYVMNADGSGEINISNNSAVEDNPSWGQMALASVGNFVWRDLDSDGLQDAGEPGMAGVVVELFNSTDGIAGNGNDVLLGTQTTDLNGFYSFANPASGSFYLQFLSPNGYIFSARDAGVDDAFDSDANNFGFTEVFTLAAGQNDTTRDAGLKQSTTTTTVSVSPNPALPGQNVVITATVNADTPGFGTLGGTVTFFDGSTVLGTGLIPQPTTWSSAASMPTIRSGLAAVTGSNGLIYAIGGLIGTTTWVNTVEVYNPSTNTWTTVASMPTARFGLAAVTGSDGLIYAIGGYNGSFLNTVEAYNPNTNTWTIVASMPTARYELGAAMGSDGLIYAIGGDNTGAQSGMNNVEAYNPNTNTWTTVASLPTGRLALGAVTGADGLTYAIGGDKNNSFLNTVEAYNPSTNAWSTFASMPTARSHLAAVTGPDGRIYAIGAYVGGAYFDTVEAYNWTTNSWAVVASMPTARSDLAAATGNDGRIYAIGGQYGNSSLNYLNTVEALNFSSASLAFSTSSLSVGTHTITAVYTGNSDFAASTSVPLTLVVTDSPTAAAIYPADSAGVVAQDAIEQDERLTSSIPKLVVVFSENMATTGMANVNSAHNWLLKRNEVEITSQISGITFGFNAAENRHEAQLSFSTPLTDGAYELKARSALTDLAGNRLDGNLDGDGFGEDRTHRFSIEAPAIAGSELHVNTFTTSNQRTFPETPQSVATDANGNFVVTWSSYNQDGAFWGVYAQRYSAAGELLGSEFRVNSYTTGSQQYATVATDDDGDFVVTWTSDHTNDVYAQRYNPAGVPQGNEFRVNTYTTSLQRYSSVAMDAGGGFAVTWSSFGQDGFSFGVYAQRYNAVGVPQGSEFRVNTYTTSIQQYSSVAMDDDGDFAVTWLSFLQDGSDYGVFAQRFSSAGVPQGSEFQVNTYTTSIQRYPSVAMDDAGDFVVTWSSLNQDGDNYGVFAQRFNSAGARQGSEFRVNGYTTNIQLYSTASMDADGDFVVAWSSNTQDGNSYGVFAQRYSAAGEPQGSEIRVNTQTTSIQRFSAASMDADGDFVVAWSSWQQEGLHYGTYAQRFAATPHIDALRIVGDLSGVTTGERLIAEVPAGPSLSVMFSREMDQIGGAAGATSVTNPTNWNLTESGVDISSQITSVSFSGTTATLTLSTALGNGNYVLTAKSTIQDTDSRALDGDWNGSPGGDFSRAFSIQLPMVTGSEFRVNTYTTGTQGGFNLTAQAVAADAAGDYVVTWTSEGQDGSSYGIYAQRYNSAGLPLGGEFRVNSYTTGLQLLSTVAMSDTGDFVVTWSDFGGFGSTHTGVFAQRYNAAGVPQGSEFRVNSYTTGAQLLSSVAMDADGDFVITWSGSNQDGSGYGVYAQRFSADGVPQGSEFRVNTYSTSSQRNSAVSMDAGGNFVVVWQSYEQDGSQYGIYAQRYSANGSPLGGEFRASTETFLQQRFATVAADDSGDFVIVWASVQDGGIYGIYGQRFDSSGLPQGSEFRVNSYTTDIQQYARVAIDADGDFVVTWKSNGQDGSDYGIYGQRFGAAGAVQGSEFRINSTTVNRQIESAVAMDSDGDFIVVWSSLNQDGSNYGVYAQRYVGSPPLQIVSMTPSYTGFEIEFNRDVNPTVLNLYDEGGALGVADVTLTGASTGAVRGSVVIEPGSHKLTFIKSGGRLAPDVYTIGLRSNTAGFIDPSGSLLDGNGDGSADDYLARFTITPPPAAVTLGIADFTRGYGQAVNLPAAASTGLPITISNAMGVKSASFALVYDPALLSITGATLGSGIVGTFSLDTTLVGIARITITSGTQLSATAGAQTLVNLTAAVPSGATYSAKEILKLSSIQLTDTTLAAISALDDNGIHVAAYLGDANGSQTYNAPDATAAQRLIVGSNSGLAAYQLADPYLIVDINDNGQMQSDDVTQIQRAIVGLSTSQIPPHPGMSPAATGGPDPIVSIPQNLVAGVDQTVTVPVELLVTEPTGITLAGADIAIAYDSSTLELTDADVGQLLIGFGLSVNTSTPGLVRLTLGGSPLNLDYSTSGVLATLQFTVIAGAGTTARINLLQSSAALQTALYDAAGRALTLSPAPTNSDDDEVDGLISILGNDQREKARELPAVDRAFDGEADFTAELLEELAALIDGEF